MTLRVLSLRWLLREIPLAYRLLFMAAVVATVCVYMIDWSKFRRDNVAHAPIANPEQRYAGSIIVPTDRDTCWTFTLDNRTGELRDGGYVKCDATARQRTDRVSPDVGRIDEMGKAFRSNAN